MLNPTGWHLAGESGFVWAGTATFVLIVAYFTLPEMKHRSYRELDLLFVRGTSARKFRTTYVENTDTE